MTTRLKSSAHYGGWLSDDLREAIGRRGRELAGLALVIVSFALGVALATWSTSDPSITHATDRVPQNMLGLPGAIISDLMMQAFGLGAMLIVLPVAVWGLHLVAKKEIDRERLRLLAALGATISAAAALDIAPRPETWPLPTGVGGLVGAASHWLWSTLLGMPFQGFAPILGGVVMGCCAFFLIVFACAIDISRMWVPSQHAVSPHGAYDEDDEDDLDTEDDGRSSSPTLGAVMHWAMAGPAIARRLMGRGRRRQEPRFDAPEEGYEDHADYAREPSHRRMAVQPPVGPVIRQGPAVGQRSEAFEPAAFDPEDDEDDDYAPPPDRAATGRPRAQAAPKRAPARPVREVYELPSLDLLQKPPATKQATTESPAALAENARMLEGVLEDFGVRGEIINVRPGPVVTLYELEPAPGIKSSRVIGLADDIARSMSAVSARVAVIPGRNVIGIELPNRRRETVYFQELLAREDFQETKARLPLCLGKTIGGEAVIADLARMPHLLIAGTTGSGKSVAVNTMILSLLYRLTPAECRLIMVDPKMLELSVYDGIPHLLAPVVTDPKKAVVALKWAVREMEDRYRKMSKVGVRNIDGFNARVGQAAAKGESVRRTVQTGFDKETGQAIFEDEEMDLTPLPYIVVIVDEMADLMMVAGKEIEGAIQRLAQMARAAGIHIVTATQRPSVDVITGTIKANFPTRISFQVTSKIDSRTILGEQGAEQLLGQGDMLYMMGGGRISRVHGPFCSDAEVETVVAHLKRQGAPDYVDQVTADEDDMDGPGGGMLDMGGEGADLYDQAVAVVLRDRKVSTSYIQRRLSIGYNRAASIIERMEKEGVVGAANHAGKREILVPDRGEE